MRWVLVIAALAWLAADPLGAQAPVATDSSAKLETKIAAQVAGKADGRRDAPASGTWFLFGIIGGPLTVALAAATAGDDIPEPPPVQLRQWAQSGGETVALSYRDTYQAEYRRAVRKHALTGSILGTLVTTLLVVQFASTR